MLPSDPPNEQPKTTDNETTGFYFQSFLGGGEPSKSPSSSSVRFEAQHVDDHDGENKYNRYCDRKGTTVEVTIQVLPEATEEEEGNNYIREQHQQLHQHIVATRDGKTGAIFIDLKNFSGRLEIRRGNFQRQDIGYRQVEEDFVNDDDEEGKKLPHQQQQQLLQRLPPITTKSVSFTSQTSSRQTQAGGDDGNDDDDDEEDGAGGGGGDKDDIDRGFDVPTSSIRERNDDDNIQSLSSTDRTTARESMMGVNDDEDEDGQDDDDDDDDENGDDDHGNDRISGMTRSSDASTRMSFIQLMELQSASMKKSAKGWTPMHRLVASQDLSVKKLEDMLGIHESMVRARDGDGRLPIHVLGNNCGLLSSLDGQLIAKQCALLLIEAFPESVVKKDDSGRVPFTHLIFGWVAWSHLRMEMIEASSRGVSATNYVYGINTALHQLQNLAMKISDWDGQSNNNESPPDGNTLRQTFEASAGASIMLSQSSNKFPPVIIFEQVEWSFRMLSFVMDYIGCGHISGNTIDSVKRDMPLLSHRKQRQNRELLAQNLVTIPQLFKTVLLLESKDIRERITRCSVFRRAMFCEQSVGPWLTSMLRSDKGNSSEIAIQYLESISQLSLVDYIGNSRTPLPKDALLFDRAKIGIYDHIDEVNDVIPSLLVLRDDLLDRAVALHLIWRMMNRRITTAFTVGLTVTDCLLHLTLIIAVRDIAFQAYESTDTWLGRGAGVVISIAAYQILRRAVEIFVLARISKKVARRYFFNFYNILDFLGIVGALATVGLGADFSGAMLPALILGLLWFRILSFLKVVNEQLATFIFALKKIVFDIRFFLLVFLILIFCFGDMFHLFYLTSPSIDCTLLDDDVSNDFCADNSVYSYLRVYSLILGDFELSQYQLSDGVTFLFVTLTLLGTIIMLNVLIAVVTNSYEGSIGTSVIIFRKSRAEFVVSHVAAERFMRPQEHCGQSSNHQNDSNGSAWVPGGSESTLNRRPTDITRRAGEAVRQLIFRLLLRWIVVIVFLFTITLSAAYTVDRIWYKAANEDSNFIFLLFMIVFALLLVYSIWATLMFILSMLIQGVPQAYKNGSGCTWLRKVNEAVIRHTASFMFGIDTSNPDGNSSVLTKSGAGHNEEELLSRMDKMESLLEYALEKFDGKEADGTLKCNR